MRRDFSVTLDIEAHLGVRLLWSRRFTYQPILLSDATALQEDAGEAMTYILQT